MSVIGSNILAGASGQGGGYNLTKSLRFRSSASAYLSRTPASAGNRKTWTWSAWVKRGALGVYSPLFIAGTTNGQQVGSLAFSSAGGVYDKLELNFGVQGTSTEFWLQTTQVFRDPSAWYHIVCAVDTTQATSSNRVKFYVNGTQVTALSSYGGYNQYPSPNYDTSVNNTVQHLVSRDAVNTAGYFDGYMAEVNFIDGLALTPSSFGETSTTTGVWIPKKYTGTYGTNGFYLTFTDTTSTSTLGTDFSGNSNTWTVNNISLTSGSTYDSMNDVPTLTSATTANYCVINPLANSGIGTLSNGNLQLVTSTNSKTITGTLALPSTGQYYWEITATDYITDNGTFFGVVNQSFLTGAPSNGTWLGFNTYSATYNNGTSTDTNGLTGTNVTNDGDIWCIAVDVTNNKFWIGRSRAGSLTWADGTTPAVNGSGATTLSLPSGDLYPMAYRGGSDNETYNFNFGQQPFAHTPPTGFVALNTFNLPTPTIGATASTTANKYMDVLLHNGNGGSQSITGLNFAPDFWWVKSRNLLGSHCLFDQIRGANSSLFSELTLGENNNWTGQSFNSNGVTADAAYSYQTNGSGYTFVDWFWKANGAGSSNTAGSITSTVSASTTAGFSIVTYTGTGANATVGHGLGVTPAMVIVKRRSGTQDWAVWHQNLSGGQYVLYLNLTAAEQIANITFQGAPTSTVLQVGTSSEANGSSQTYVAYCFAPVAGYSAFGSYTGNGSTDGPFVFTGFRPRFIMMKASSAARGWIMFDTARDPYNVAQHRLFANTSDAESSGTTANNMDILSNGFKLRLGSNSEPSNESGTTYIYMAFAEHPFKYSLAR